MSILNTIPQVGPTCWAFTSAAITKELLVDEVGKLFDFGQIAYMFRDKTFLLGISCPEDLNNLGLCRARSINNGPKVYVTFALHETEVTLEAAVQKLHDNDVMDIQQRSFVYLEGISDPDITHSAIIREIRLSDAENPDCNDMIICCLDPNGDVITFPNTEWNVLSIHTLSINIYCVSEEKGILPADITMPECYGIKYFALPTAAKYFILNTVKMGRRADYIADQDRWAKCVYAAHSHLSLIWKYPSNNTLHAIMLFGTLLLGIWKNIYVGNGDKHIFKDSMSITQAFKVYDTRPNPKISAQFFKNKYIPFLVNSGILEYNADKTTFIFRRDCVYWLSAINEWFVITPGRPTKDRAFQANNKYINCLQNGLLHSILEPVMDDNNNNNNNNHSFDYLKLTPPKQNKHRTKLVKLCHSDKILPKKLQFTSDTNTNSKCNKYTLIFILMACIIMTCIISWILLYFNDPTGSEKIGGQSGNILSFDDKNQPNGDVVTFSYDECEIM